MEWVVAGVKVGRFSNEVQPGAFKFARQGLCGVGPGTHTRCIRSSYDVWMGQRQGITAEELEFPPPSDTPAQN